MARRRRRAGVALGLLVAMVGPLAAEPLAPGAEPIANDWYVDAGATSCAAGLGTPAAPYCTIMEAVVAAADGDTIHIAPGTYGEQLILYKDLTLIGTEGDAVTIVQGPGGRVVRPWSGTNVVIDGLTITGGRGYSKATGLFLGVFPQPPTVTLRNSTISGNQSRSAFSACLGAGVYVGGGSLTIASSTIADNSGYGYDYGGGGGVHLRGGSLTILDSTISGNSSTSYGTAYGGGVLVRGGQLTVLNSRIQDNSAAGSFDDGRRGSSAADGRRPDGAPDAPPPFTTAYGGGLAATGGVVVLRNTTVTDNRVSGDAEVGSAVAVGAASVQLDFCTVSANFSLRRAAALEGGPSLDARNSIVWANVGPEVGGFGPTLTYCDVQGGWPGVGNLSSNPLFVDTAALDYSLSPGSPCIDAADPAAAPTGLDLDGFPRYLDGDLDRSMRADIGAHEFNNLRLAVTGSATPGGSLAVSVDGTPGMNLILAGGFSPGETLFVPWGSIYFNLEAPFQRFSFGISPNSANLAIPPTIVGPLDVVLQAFGAGAPLRTGNRPGNFSNPVFLRIE